MKQEDKDLLLKDLCARLPYNPMVEYKGESYNVLGITHGRLVLCKPFMSYTLNEHPLVEEVKLCLFPLSSMTEEQKEEYGKCYDIDLANCAKNLCDRLNGKDTINGYPMYNHIDWCNKNYFDYRGLIPMGLAIDCSDLNIY